MEETFGNLLRKKMAENRATEQNNVRERYKENLRLLNVYLLKFTPDYVRVKMEDAVNHGWRCIKEIYPGSFLKNDVYELEGYKSLKRICDVLDINLSLNVISYKQIEAERKEAAEKAEREKNKINIIKALDIFIIGSV